MQFKKSFIYTSFRIVPKIILISAQYLKCFLVGFIFICYRSTFKVLMREDEIFFSLNKIPESLPRFFLAPRIKFYQLNSDPSSPSPLFSIPFIINLSVSCYSCLLL